MKILYKILLPVLLAASIGLFISTIYTYETGMKTFTETSISLQKMATVNALNELKAGLDFNILNAISLAQTGILQPYLSGDLALQKAYTPDTNSRIINMRNTYYYVMLGVLSSKGKVLEHTEPHYIGKNFSDKPFFKEAMQGKVSIGAPYKYKNMVVYPVASPVYDLRTLKIIGVVFNVSKLTDTMSKRMLLGDKGYLFVADKNGTVFIHKDNSLVLETKLYDSEWGTEILKNRRGSLTFTENKEEKIAYYDFLPEADWIAIAVRDLDELAAPGKMIRKNAMIIAVITLIVLAAIIYFYIKHIIDALLQAIQYAEQVAKGVLDKDLDLSLTNTSYGQRIWTKIYKKYCTLVGKEENIHHKHKIQNLMEFKRSDEIGTLYEALQVMVHSMRTMIKKADDSNRMKSEFLANMSHEIRTPLNAVIGLAHLCLTSTENEHKKRDYVMKIESAGKSLLGIINNILDTSKIEAGMFELEEVQFNLQDVGEQVLTIHQENAATKGLELLLEMDENINRYYIGDPIRLGQVLNNLVGNAIKFTEKGSVKVIFSANEVPLGSNCQIPSASNPPHSSHSHEGKISLCIQVSDSGIGFSKEQEEILFKPFAQADASITRRFGGTGLGLVISKNIIELMQGTMDVQSTLNEGTTFFIKLFLHPVDADMNLVRETEYDGSTPLDLSDKHILIVEDNMINQLIMEELLQKTNAQITIAENGQIAVDMVPQHNFDIILMDMQMPVMDGIQATEIIRKTHSSQQLPIIAITANAMKEDKEKGIAVGLNDYLTKPIDPENLMLALYNWLCARTNI